MDPDSLTFAVSNSQENTYGESDDPASLNWTIAVRKSQGPEMPSTPGVFGINSFDRFLKLRIGELAMKLSTSTENLPSSDLSELIRIICISYLLDSWGYSKCARRIYFLQNYDDFEEGEKPLSLESAKSFLEFVSDTDFHNRFSELGEPALGLSADGTLGATWRIAENKHLLVKFHHNTMVSFAMIGPNSDSPEDGKFRLNGRNTREEVIKTLHRQGVASWEDH